MSSCTICEAPLSCECCIPQLPSSPYPGATSNSGLSAAEGLDLRSLFDDVSSQTRTLESHIVRLEDLLWRCRTSLADHYQFIGDHKALLSSTNRLPPDLWARIFSIAAEQPIQPDAQHPLIGPPTAFTIAAVCGDWRQCVLNTRSLWSTIVIKLQRRVPASALVTLNSFFARGGDTPLHISVSTGVDTAWEMLTSTERGNLGLLLGILLKHGWHWETCFFSLPSGLYDNLSSLPVATPLLKSLSLFTHNYYESQGWSPTFISEAPLLKHFECGNFLTTLEAFKALVPWSSMVSVKLGALPPLSSTRGFTVDEVRHVLFSSPNLPILNIPDLDVMQLDPSQPALIHDHLEVLHLTCPTSLVLPMLYFPALRSLRLTWIDLSDSRKLSAAISHSPNLRHIQFLWCATLNLRDLFPKGCKIQEISIGICDLNNISERPVGFPQSLAALGNADLPCLRILDIAVHLGHSEFLDTVALPLIRVVEDLAIALASGAGPSVAFRVEIPQYALRTEDTREAFRSLSSKNIPGLEISLAGAWRDMFQWKM